MAALQRPTRSASANRTRTATPSAARATSPGTLTRSTAAGTIPTQASPASPRRTALRNKAAQSHAPAMRLTDKVSTIAAEAKARSTAVDVHAPTSESTTTTTQNQEQLQPASPPPQNETEAVRRSKAMERTDEVPPPHVFQDAVLPWSGEAFDVRLQPDYYAQRDIVRCVCGTSMADALETREMVLCDNCEQWQHVPCMGLDSEDLPDDYFCHHCLPELHQAVLAKQPHAALLPARPPTPVALGVLPPNRMPPQRPTNKSANASGTRLPIDASPIPHATLRKQTRPSTPPTLVKIKLSASLRPTVSRGGRLSKEQARLVQADDAELDEDLSAIYKALERQADRRTGAGAGDETEDEVMADAELEEVAQRHSSPPAHTPSIPAMPTTEAEADAVHTTDLRPKRPRSPVDADTEAHKRPRPLSTAPEQDVPSPHIALPSRPASLPRASMDPLLPQVKPNLLQATGVVVLQRVDPKTVDVSPKPIEAPVLTSPPVPPPAPAPVPVSLRPRPTAAEIRARALANPIMANADAHPSSNESADQPYMVDHRDLNQPTEQALRRMTASEFKRAFELGDIRYKDMVTFAQGILESGAFPQPETDQMCLPAWSALDQRLRDAAAQKITAAFEEVFANGRYRRPGMWLLHLVYKHASVARQKRVKQMHAGQAEQHSAMQAMQQQQPALTSNNPKRTESTMTNVPRPSMAATTVTASAPESVPRGRTLTTEASTNPSTASTPSHSPETSQRARRGRPPRQSASQTPSSGRRASQSSPDDASRKRPEQSVQVSAPPSVEGSGRRSGRVKKASARAVAAAAAEAIHVSGSEAEVEETVSVEAEDGDRPTRRAQRSRKVESGNTTPARTRTTTSSTTRTKKGSPLQARQGSKMSTPTTAATTTKVKLPPPPTVLLPATLTDVPIERHPWQAHATAATTTTTTSASQSPRDGFNLTDRTAMQRTSYPHPSMLVQGSSSRPDLPALPVLSALPPLPQQHLQQQHQQQQHPFVQRQPGYSGRQVTPASVMRSDLLAPSVSVPSMADPASATPTAAAGARPTIQIGASTSTAAWPPRHFPFKATKFSPGGAAASPAIYGVAGATFAGGQQSSGSPTQTSLGGQGMQGVASEQGGQGKGGATRNKAEVTTTTTRAFYGRGAQ